MSDDLAVEQKVRDMLERMGVPYAQSYTAGTLVELANACHPTTDQLKLARLVAMLAHKGQKEESTGDDYIHHVARVVDLVATTEEKIVAYLHDVCEDCEIFEDDPDDLLPILGFAPRIVTAVLLLTRGWFTAINDPYDEYIQSIKRSGDPLAISVKIADLKDHLRPNCPERLRPKYEKALEELTMDKLTQTLKSLEQVIKAAYTGSAEHGAFFRSGSQGEITPSPFILFEDLEKQFYALTTELKQVKAECASVQARYHNMVNDKLGECDALRAERDKEGERRVAIEEAFRKLRDEQKEILEDLGVERLLVASLRAECVTLKTNSDFYAKLVPGIEADRDAALASVTDLQEAAQQEILRRTKAEGELNALCSQLKSVHIEPVDRVKELTARAERAEAERDKWLMNFNRSEQFQNGPTKRAEALQETLITVTKQRNDADRQILDQESEILALRASLDLSKSGGDSLYKQVIASQAIVDKVKKLLQSAHWTQDEFVVDANRLVEIIK